MTTNEQAIETYRSLISIMTEGVKALLLINGGAIVALLAYLGQLKDRQAPLAARMALPMGFLIAGLVLAFLTLVFSYATQYLLFNKQANTEGYENDRHVVWQCVALIAAFGSIICFAVGAYKSVLVLTAG